MPIESQRETITIIERKADGAFSQVMDLVGTTIECEEHLFSLEGGEELCNLAAALDEAMDRFIDGLDAVVAKNNG